MDKTQEAAHTPGPWEAKFTPGAGLSVHANVSKALGPRYSGDCPIYHLGTDATGLQISYELWTQFPRAEWDAMQQANARLIAAAPELLDNLRAAANYIDTLGGDSKGYRATIAKAMEATAPTAPSLALTAFIQDVEAAEGKATGAQS